MQIAFLFIAHMPYVRHAGPQPEGEDALHAMIAQSLLPFVEMLVELHSTRLPIQVGLACSPLLLEQLADPLVQKHFVLWMEKVIAQREASLAEAEARGDTHAAYLERFYVEWIEQRLSAFTERFNRHLPAWLRELTVARVIEPLACPASYAYLPLLGREESVHAQIECGMLHTTRHLGRLDGLWLPGCSWRPGLEGMMAEIGLRYVVADRSSLVAQQPPTPINVIPGRVAALFPDEDLARHIWSEDLGYPGDPLYRDPDDPSGYHARSGALYDPYHALRRAQNHAVHFTQLLVAEEARAGADDLRLILLDAAQLGTRWVEGPTWLQAMLMLSTTHGSLRLTTPGAYVRNHRPRVQGLLKEGSWAAGVHGAWQGGVAEVYWQEIHRAEEAMVELALAFPDAVAEHERLLNQAARELFLAQTSDWPALLSAGAGEEGWAARWRTYLQRFSQLAELARHRHLQEADLALLGQLEEEDGLFASLNYRIFAPAS
ncbi:1,4-alpha-glucan branching protein domain-containing protein [Candidatus Chloroploca asiatica]|uniref:Glycoside hydrolase n=1 Tax=Candidatus Chloroploca asiatica TaxID=1506545 RepID=A0A2H3KYE1_9CHLR|nr:1,4-alpha-glucan branching protein domain-containing protein [Candidatus Chloroploca asiatica]PDV97371.1 hypothetical protein A9Q02_18630 [Candidatus Chloroploca asiatica]